MPQPRYLAPWHQPDIWDDPELWESLDGTELDVEALKALRGKPAIYHCISRVVNRALVFGPDEKEHFVSLMRACEAFCQVRVLAFCVMSNHFHILVEVPTPPEDRGTSWSDDDFLAHLETLYGETKIADVAGKLQVFRRQKNHRGAEKLRHSFFRRMWDLSCFMQALKQRFTRWFNRVHERCGTLWEDRFKSVLVESGHAARMVAAYIDLNPVRAGIASAPEHYRWCSFAEAVAGKERARQGLQRVMFEDESRLTSEERAAEMLLSWRKAAARYRAMMLNDLNRGRRPERPGEHEEVREAPLSEREALGCRLRHFVDGLVIGTGGFVEAMFRATRQRFGPRRASGPRRLRGVQTPLRSARDLVKRPVG